MEGSFSDRDRVAGWMAVLLGWIVPRDLERLPAPAAGSAAAPIESLLEQAGLIDANQRATLAGLVEQQSKGQAVESRSFFARIYNHLHQLERSPLAQSIPEDDSGFLVDSHATAHRMDTETPANLQETAGVTRSAPGPSRGRFQILRSHAKGGLGEVFVAFDSELNREVALKEIQGKHAASPESRQRFLVEGELTGRLEHPGIVPVYSLGASARGNPFYVMRFVRGGSLKAAIDRLYQPGSDPVPAAERPLEIRKLVQRLVGVCNAIEYAHSRKVLHRDLKPGNIMLGKFGETLVVDWGLAKVLDSQVPDYESSESACLVSSGEGSSRTRVGTIVGTPAYMSPEQAEGQLDRMGPWTDVYGLGATLYYILTGQPPFSKDEDGELYAKIRSGQFPPPSLVRPGVPRALEAVCLKAMRTDPNQRYRSAAAMAEDLERWLAGDPPAAWREPLPERVFRWVRRNRTGVATAAALLLASTIGLVFFNFLISRQNQDLKIARDAAESNASLADEQRKIAQERLENTRKSTLKMVDVAELALSELPNRENDRQDVMKEAIRIYREILEQDPKDSEAAVELAGVIRKMATLQRTFGKFPESTRLYLESIGMLEKLAAGPDPSPTVIDLLAQNHADVAANYSSDNGTEPDLDTRSQKALAELDRAFAVFRRLPDDRQANVHGKRTLGRIHLDKAGILTAMGKATEAGRREEAVEHARAAVDCYRAVIQSESRSVPDFPLLIGALGRLGELLAAADRPQEAEPYLKEAVQTAFEKLKTQHDPSLHAAAVRAVVRLVQFQLNAGQVHEEMGEQLKTALGLSQGLIQGFPSTARHQVYFAALLDLQDSYWRQKGKRDLSRSGLQQNFEAREFLYRIRPSAASAVGLVRSLLELAQLDQQEDKPESLAESLRRIGELCDEAREKYPDEKQALRELAGLEEQAAEFKENPAGK